MARWVVVLTDAQIRLVADAVRYKLDASPDGDGDGPKAGSPTARALEAALRALGGAARFQTDTKHNPNRPPERIRQGDAHVEDEAHHDFPLR